MQKKQKKAGKQANKHIMEDEEDFDVDNETDSEDEQVGLIKWCVKEKFKRRKARSVNTS